MYKLQLEFNSNCDVNKKMDMINMLEELFGKENIRSFQVVRDTYEYVSVRTDNKLLGSFWAVLFKLKRGNYGIQKMFSRFEWIHYSENKKEIREDLLVGFFEEKS